MSRPAYISLPECKHGSVYSLNSRNLSFGVFNSSTAGFTGIRTKFNNKFLFTEYHFDYCPHHGTAKPIAELLQIPSHIPLDCFLKDESGKTYLWAQRNEVLTAVVRKNLPANAAPHGKRSGFEDLWIDTKERLPDNTYPFSRENHELIEFLSTITI